jgi:hypothetical protein
VVSPIAFLVGVALWLAPPMVLLTGVTGWLPVSLMAWSAVVYGVSVVIWVRFTHIMRGPPLYGFLYPLGAIVGSYIFMPAWKRGRHVEWKGRSYTVRAPSETL